MLSKTFLSTLTVGQKQYRYYDLKKLQDRGLTDIKRLPYAIRVLVENVLRKLDGTVVKEEDLKAIANWQPHYDQAVEIPFHPARVLMQDFTGVPAVVDLAAMRDAVKTKGDDPRKINPLVPVELIVDHSVQIDAHGTADCRATNVAREYERNVERYQLLKWAQKSFANFKVVPPNSGICHQVNLEYLGRVVFSQDGRPGEKEGALAFPDTLVGTDSHTTMINGIGVLGVGCGRHRSRSRHARPAVHHVRSGSGRRSSQRQSANRGHGHRPGIDHHPAAAQPGGGGKDRRVFRPGPPATASNRPGHHRQYESGIWGHGRIFPHRRENGSISFHDQSQRAGRAYRSLCQSQRHVLFR